MVAGAGPEATHDQPPAAPLAPAILEPLEQAAMAPHRHAAGEVQAIPAPWASGEDRAAATPALEA
jgi:hypothetical protein